MAAVAFGVLVVRPQPRSMEEVFAPLAIVPLADARASVTVPSTHAWRWASIVWGDPRLLITAIGPGGGAVLGRGNVGAEVAVSGRDAARGATPTTGVPYGRTFSSSSAPVDAPFVFSLAAEAGESLELQLVRSSTRPLPKGELMVVSDYATKDRLVGLSVEQEMEPYVRAILLGAFGLGAVLAVWGSMAGLWRRFRRRGTENPLSTCTKP